MWIDDEIKTDNSSSKYTVDTIINALKAERKINFRYIDYNENYEKILRRDGHLYSVSPYYLVWNEEDYYLLGSPDSHDNLTHFQISMMVDTSISDDVRKRREDIIQLKGTFDLGKHIRENISMLTFTHQNRQSQILRNKTEYLSCQTP
jgi:predicted DNA-binding transcriptional regulator YafY